MEEKDNEQKGANPTDKELGSAKSAKEIIDGAKQEDQLDRLNQNVPDGGRDSHPERKSGTPPGEYDPHDRK